MSIITLTTDFGLKDYFVAAIKGEILSVNSNINLVDISHKINKFNILEASYVFKNTYAHFPKNTIHIIDVDSEININSKALIINHNNQFFIGVDNGFFSLIFNENVDSIIEIDLTNYSNTNFIGLDVFAKIAGLISLGSKISDFGDKIDEFKKIEHYKPYYSQNSLKGNVIYSDNKGNIVTNISKDLFLSNLNERNFEIIINSYSFKKIFTSYASISNEYLIKNSSIHIGTKFAIFNHQNLLEIGIYKGSNEIGGTASTLLGLKTGDSITIIYK